MLVSCLAYYSALKMGAACSFETVDIQQTTWRYIPEDRILHSHPYENLKLYILHIVDSFCYLEGNVYYVGL
jgi:hypothetical protein